MVTIRCAGCNKRLLSYDNTSIKRYESPVKKCKKCGRRYADPRCHEIAVEGLPDDLLRVKGYLVLMALGAFILYRGIHLFGLRQINMPDYMQWFLPTTLTLIGVGCIIGAIVEIIMIKTGKKEKKYERLRMESEQRLSDKSYAYILKDLGYPVPERYL